MQVTNFGTVEKCMSPDGCPNLIDPDNPYVVVYNGKGLLLCPTCGPIYLRKKAEGR